MQIKKVEVKNLFGYYSYEIKCTENRPITIIHAPNGYGKTTVLKLIKSVLELDFKSIYEIPIEKFTIEFYNGAIITIYKSGDFIKEKSNKDKLIKIRYIIIHDEHSFDYEFTINDRTFEEIIEWGLKASLKRDFIRSRHLIDEDSGYKQVNDSYRMLCVLEELLNTICSKSSLDINFIDSNRLFISNNQEIKFYKDRNISIRELDFIGNNKINLDTKNESSSMSESIIKYSSELLEIIADIRGKFANVSEAKERDFPNRLVEFVNESINTEETKESLNKDQIIEKLSILETKREELEKLGLVLKGKTTTLPQDNNPNETMLKFYTLYISDTEQKLQVFDGIKKKLELLLNIINTKTQFSNKRMRIDNKSGVIFEPINTNINGKHIIPLEKLSSGEKHDFILFYELIFKCDKNCIVLIDEPEISLHVAWQMEFINELSKICEMNGMQAIIATHSPDIVNGNNDLLVSLGEE